MRYHRNLNLVYINYSVVNWFHYMSFRFKSQNLLKTLSEDLLYIVYPSNKSICMVIHKCLALSKAEKVTSDMFAKVYTEPFKHFGLFGFF